MDKWKEKKMKSRIEYLIAISISLEMGIFCIAVMLALPVVDFSGMETPLYSDGFCTVINTWVSENSIRLPKSKTA